MGSQVVFHNHLSEGSFIMMSSRRRSSNAQAPPNEVNGFVVVDSTLTIQYLREIDVFPAAWVAPDASQITA